MDNSTTSNNIITSNTISWCEHLTSQNKLDQGSYWLGKYYCFDCLLQVRKHRKYKGGIQFLNDTLIPTGEKEKEEEVGG